ncbi:hypothetical protein QQS21_002051 [Conoideocrella luteorostrata]|uniref:Uncharacterized protein n=1 Tax=Conoideocrella luteorostrata TaxID=1105319 RepID=A0AAJ0CYS0_9HYPO|nr:hypothetical protein QQS21_002051 [Conoideocrella luteorostrata]
MKYALFFASAIALTSALPQDNHVKKLPWMKPGQFSNACGAMAFDEESCGTKWFCENLKRYPDIRFKNADECFAAHEPEPKPVGLTDAEKATRANDQSALQEKREKVCEGSRSKRCNAYFDQCIKLESGYGKKVALEERVAWVENCVADKIKWFQ